LERFLEQVFVFEGVGGFGFVGGFWGAFWCAFWCVLRGVAIGWSVVGLVGGCFLSGDPVEFWINKDV